MKTKKKIKRREFLSGTISCIAPIGILGISNRIIPWYDHETADQNPEKKVIYRTLGKTGIKLPIVNMGVMNTLDPALVRRSYEIGVRHFDTAAWYMQGKNEEMVGKVIKEMNIRDQVVIGTKVYIPHQQRTMSPEQAKEEYLRIAGESLERLQTDYVDILYSHSVKDIEWLNNPGILDAMQILKKEGKVKFIGFSTHDNMAECIKNAAMNGFYDVVLTSFNYSLNDNYELASAIENAALKGIGIIAMKTQCSQAWHKQNLSADLQQYYEGNIIHKAVLKWALQHEFVTTAIPGYTTFKQMEEDFSVVYDLEYTPEEKEFLENRSIKLSLKQCCQQCNQCVSTCPNKVDIPTLMRVHMYAACYPNFYQARDTLSSIPEEKSLSACASCTVCTASCANRVDIPGRIEELKTIYI